MALSTNNQLVNVDANGVNGNGRPHPSNGQIATFLVARPQVDLERLQWLGRELLLAIGEDPERDGLNETPRRFARWWREFIEYDPGCIDTAFEMADRIGQMVVVSGLRVWSLCEHHLLPFWCDISIAYIPKGQVLGLSKFARIADLFAHKLQIQERLVQQVAEMVKDVTGSDDVAVFAEGEHLCMVMRGIKKPGLMTSLMMNGKFQDSADLRSEFLSIVRNTHLSQR